MRGVLLSIDSATSRLEGSSGVAGSDLRARGTATLNPTPAKAPITTMRHFHILPVTIHTPPPLPFTLTPS